MKKLFNRIEQWKDIVGYNGNYKISDLGNVISFKGNNSKILKPSNDGYGYPFVALYKNGKAQQIKIHRLVGTHFIENIFNKREINHKNGIKTDNRVENLEWCTSSENQIHAFKTGLQKIKYGEDMWTSKLTLKDVLKIKELKTKGNITVQKIADMFGINKRHVFRIVSGERWGHLLHKF